MFLLADSAGGGGLNELFKPWELHPALTHFPIALLLGGLAVDLYAWARGSLPAARVATGLYLAGVLTGVVTGLAGLLAFYTVPASHTEQAHDLILWHIGVQLAAIVLFAWPALVRWKNSTAAPGTAGRLLACVAAVLLIIGSGIGGYIVYHGGMGIEPDLMSRELRKGHEHHPSGTPGKMHGGHTVRAKR